MSGAEKVIFYSNDKYVYTTADRLQDAKLKSEVLKFMSNKKRQISLKYLWDQPIKKPLK